MTPSATWHSLGTGPSDGVEGWKPWAGPWAIQRLSLWERRTARDRQCSSHLGSFPVSWQEAMPASRQPRAQRCCSRTWLWCSFAHCLWSIPFHFSKPQVSWVQGRDKQCSPQAEVPWRWSLTCVRESAGKSESGPFPWEAALQIPFRLFKKHSDLVT